MKIHEQIKKYRLESNLSQDQLAEKIYVSRQTISNWENAKNYPDINSLVLLSKVFSVSLDKLVKGDLEEMKEQINQEDVRIMKRDSAVFTVLLIGSVVSMPFLFNMEGYVGKVTWVIIYAIACIYGVKLEKQKKNLDIQTYREISAFFEGKTLDEIQKYKEIGKRPYQTFLYVVGIMVIAAAVVYGICYLFFPK